MIKTNSESVNHIFADWEEEEKGENDDEDLAPLVEIRSKMSLICSIVTNTGVAEDLAHDGASINNNVERTREFIMIKYFAEGPVVTEETLPPSSVRSAATYVVDDPRKINIRATIDTSEDIIEDLNRSQKTVLIMLSEKSPFMAVRTNPTVNDDGTVAVHVHTNGRVFDGKTLIILKKTILGLAFSGIYKCCNVGADSPLFGRCMAQCPWQDINCLHWSGGMDQEDTECDQLF